MEFEKHGDDNEKRSLNDGAECPYDGMDSDSLTAVDDLDDLRDQ